MDGVTPESPDINMSEERSYRSGVLPTQSLTEGVQNGDQSCWLSQSDQSLHEIGGGWGDNHQNVLVLMQIW